MTLTLPEGVQADLVAYRDYRSETESEERPGAIVREDEAETLRHALREPFGCPPLSRLAVGKNSAVILISDVTRLCPSYKFLELLLGELNDGGIEDERIRIIVALGMHRAQSEAELTALVGEKVRRRVAVSNHSAQPEDCINVGVTTRGTPLEINRAVAAAELRIATGNIEPHRLAGMSGGVKALVPGVASSRTIEANHSLSKQATVTPGDVDNPIHRDMEEAQSFLPIHFLFNVAVDHRRNVLGAVAGSVPDAHRRGVELARSFFLVTADKTYDVVFASAGGYPKDMQLYQAIKTLQNAEAIVRPGGTIVLVARCEELYGNGVFQLWAETIPDRQAALAKLKETFVLGAHKLEHLDKVLQRAAVYLYSDVPVPLAERLGLHPFDNLEDLARMLVRSPSQQVAIMPCGSITFPITKGESL